MNRFGLLAIPILLLLNGNICKGQLLRPAPINIAAGKPITATATCGVQVSEPELYCKLASVPGKFGIRGLECDRCIPDSYSRDHSIRYAVDGSERWWQSPPLSRGLNFQRINITIDLKQEYQVAYVIIKTGNAPRPGVWSLERSVDNGRTFSPWQHFATSPSECRQYFGIETLIALTRDDSVKCSTEYSSIPPFENGEIHISLVTGRPGAANFSYSPILQEWTRATHIRLRLMKVKTLLTDLLPLAREDPTVTRRYFYSIKDISVGAICMCNGHADQCVEAQGGSNEFVCRCKHNTCGARCEKCCPSFVQKGYRPGTPESSNECEACNCHQHSSECYYDANVAQSRRSLDLNNKYEGGGVCINCQHNTAGINCERCQEGYYNPTGIPKTFPDACRPCNCDTKYSTGRCYDGSGNCECKPKYGGARCDRCSEGFYGFPDCRPCDCNPAGTTGRVCGPTGNQCPCKPNFAGNKCDRCAPGYYGYPQCQRCNCDNIGSYDSYCDPTSGQCRCRQKYQSRQCNQCNRGYYSFPYCKPCFCDSEGTAPGICDPVFGQCICLKNFQGERCDKCNEGYYRFPDCIACGCSKEGSVTPKCDSRGTCNCHDNYLGLKCEDCQLGYYDHPRCIKCACDPRGAVHKFCDLRTGQCTCKGSFRGLNCNQCRAGTYGFPNCKECQCNPAGIKPISGRRFGDCSYSNNGQCDCKDNVQGLECSECKPGFHNLRPDNPRGCDACYCDLAGVVAGLANCDDRSGQCTCKQHVTGARCNTCKVGYFGLEANKEFGCTGCNCDVGGSYDQMCDANTGQCNCRPNVEGLDCSRPVQDYYYPDLLHIKAEVEDGCVPSSSGIVSRDVPGLFQSDPSRQGDEYNNCNPIRVGFDEAVYPGFSWKGYVGFNALQKEIKVTLQVPKTGRYHIEFNYALNHSQPVMGEISLSPRGQGSKQSSPVTFSSTQVGSTYVSGFAMAGDRGLPTQFMLTKGTWDLTFMAPPSKLLIDYISAIPQEYYQAYILKRKVTNPCIVNSQDPLCVQYSYINTIRPDFPTVELETGYIITRQGRQQTHVFDDKKVLEQLDFNAMAYLDYTQTRVTEDVNLPKVGDYVLIMQYYHPSDQTKTLDVYLRSRHSQQKGTFYLHSCRFKFGCRQVAVDKQRRLKIFKTNEIERRVITLLINTDTSVAVDSITAIPLEQWNLDYVVPRPLCTTKNNKCIPASYSIPKGAVQYDVAADRGKPPPNILNPKTTVKYLEGETSYSVIYNNLKTGTYNIVVHYYQPKHVTFTSRAIVTSDRAIPGQVQFGYCPNVEGCRAIVQNLDGTNSFDIGRQSGEFQMRIPQGASAWIDYVLFIPQEKFTQEVAEPNPVSFSKDFLTNCAKDSFFIKPSASSACTKPVFSLTTAFNNGTIPCECDRQGAVDSECNQFGGQCRCKQNVIGRKCNRCKTGYYDFPNCYKCQCIFCNEVTGACDCPANTVGRNCELCLKGTYGYDPILGCQDCKCDISGVIGGDVACNPVTGKCPCKPSHTGRRCNQCIAGRYGYPYCDKCDCDKRGVVSDICDAKGNCLCKVGVEGIRCDTCSAGYYNLDANNPNGCTACWCSGLSKSCSSSTLKRFTLRQMDGWLIENTPTQVVKSDSTTVMASVASRRTNPDKPIYWLAPERYTGKQIFSYGGTLTYLLIYSVPIEVINPVLTAHPDIIIRGKNGVEMSYKNHLKLQPNVVHKIQAQFIESLWSVANNSQSSRAEFMSILADIESIRLRASYSTAVADTTLSDVLMHSSLESSVGSLAKEVEKCDCPPKASGTSCELCGKGYTRDVDNSTCVKCQCHGHSNDCHPETGECYNCLHNTAGDQCQKCIKGFYGNSTKGTPNDCLLCECPLGISSNSFASECALGKNNRLTCICNKGYTGSNCDQCADGYYGDPLVPGDYCKPCSCNGNIDPLVPGSCDPFTGVCTKCINKAFGDDCERCRDGYYGDAVIAKDCAKCQCSTCGALTSLCNYTTGVCQCKKNVMGKTCDLCKPNTWNFDSCLGCEDCNCGNASLGAYCDVRTGQCVCKPGAIGRRCDRCQAGFWNYKPEGCQVCNCPVKDAAHLWGFCDVNTGQCCKAGGNCTVCPPNYILTPSGCEFCGECVGRLLETAQGLDKNITIVLDYLKKGAAGVIAQAKYKDLNDTLNKLIPPTNKYSHTMESLSVIVGISIINGTANPRPLARYPLTKKTGGKDISNHGLADAQLSNTDWIAGPDGPDSAVQFQGNENSLIRLENKGKLHSKRSSSILLWVKHEGQESPIMSFGFGKVRIWLVEDNRIEACFANGQAPNCRKSKPTARDKWIHLALVYNYDLGVTEFWVDDQLADKSLVASKLPLGTDTVQVFLGAMPQVDSFRGAVACLQIFDQPLTGQQISVLKRACHPDFVQPVPGPEKSLLERMSQSETKTTTMEDQVYKVHKNARESAKNANKTKTDALILEQDIRNALNKSRSIINLSGSIVDKLQSGSANQTILLEEAETILKELQHRDFTALNNTVNEELSFIQSVSEDVKMLLNETLGLHDEAKRARKLIAKLKKEFSGLLDTSMRILMNVSMAEQWNQRSKEYDSMTPIKKARAKTEKMERSLKLVQETLGKASSSLMNATRNFEHFNGSFGRLDDLIRQVYDRFKNLTIATNVLRPLAAKASNHSEVLRKQAKILEDLLTDTQQFAEKAIKASKVYANIALKLNEALEIARQAEGNATEAQEKSKHVNKRAKATNAESLNLLNSAASVKDRVDSGLQELLDELKDRIAQLKKKIKSVEDDLGMINNTFDAIDEHGDMGAKAKSAQQNATASQMMADDAYRIAEEIEAQLPGLKELKDSIVAANKNITEVEEVVVDAVNKSLHIKERTRIVQINQTRILKDLKEEVLDVIQEIQDMLSDSRELINKMSVVLNFTGETISNPLPPPVARDSSSIKDIELFIKPRTTDALLLYFGPTLNAKRRHRRQADGSCQNDFVSLELKDARVQAVMCMSGLYVNLQSTEEIKAIPPGTTTIVKPPPDALGTAVFDPWYKIHFNITGDRAMLMFEVYESNKKPVVKIAPRIKKINVNNPVLRIDKNNIFLLVGGIPKGVKVPPNVNMKKYQGPMDGLRIDYMPVGLWNAEKLIDPSVFYDRLAFKPKEELNTYSFHGNGYLKAGPYSTGQVNRVSFSFRTTESHGLLLLAVRDRKPEIFMMMDIVNATFRLTYNLGLGIVTLMASKPCDDGREHQVSFLEDPETLDYFTLKFDDEVVANMKKYYDDGEAEFTVTAEYVYFGGREKGKPTPQGVDMENIKGFLGCLTKPTIATALTEQIASVGFERTCSPRPVRYLTLLAPDSYLSMDGLGIDTRSFTLSVSFRTRKSTGLFLRQAHETMDFFSLGMIGGRVVLKADTGGAIKTLQTDLDNYNDGAWHHISVIKNGRMIHLYVGYESKKAQFNDRMQKIQTGNAPLFVGGLPKNYELRQQNAFSVGMKANLAGTTLRDLVFKGQIKSFINYKNKLKVIFDVEDFPLPRPRDLIIPKEPTKPPTEQPTEKEGLTTTRQSTVESTTMERTTMEPTTMEPTTMEPTTMKPTTMEPTTMEPTTMEPTTMEPTTMEPTTMEPTTMEPTTIKSTSTTPTKSTACISMPPLVRDDAIMSFLDDDNSFAKYTQITKDSVMKKVVGSRTKISLEFRTSGEDGIIYYSANGERQADFLVCYLLSGKVKCRFSAGSGSGNLVSNKTYNDNKWHTLLFTRKLKQGTLKINGIKISSATTSGVSSNVDGLQDFFLGGIPKGYISKRVEEKQAVKSFPGCVRNFMVSSKDPGAPDDLNAVTGCVTNEVESGSFFYGGYIKLVNKFRVGLSKTVMLEIKPQVDTATILSTINKGGDYLVLELIEGDLVLRVENGNGPFEVRYSPSEKGELCDGQWHRIRISKDGNTALIAVDSTDPITGKGKGKGTLKNTDVYDPLYIGGVPDGFTHKALKTTDRYSGCIRGFLDGSKQIPLSKPVGKYGDVFLNGCPMPEP